MCIRNAGSGDRDAYGEEDESSLVGFIAYEVNAKCTPGSPLWTSSVTRDSISWVSARYLAACDSDQESARFLEVPFTSFREDGSEVVTGCSETFWEYLKPRYGNAIEDFSMVPVYFGEIMRGMYLQNVYSLDEDAYKRFQPLALKYGIAANSECFESSASDCLTVLHLELVV